MSRPTRALSRQGLGAACGIDAGGVALADVVDEQHGAVGGAGDTAPHGRGLDHLRVAVLLQCMAFGERVADDQADAVFPDQPGQGLLVWVGDVEAVIVRAGAARVRP